MSYEGAKILVVDDEMLFSNALKQVLSQTHTVFVASNGKDAIRMAGEIIPDLILLDLVLPDIIGFDVFKELKKDISTQNIPVIFITSRNNVEDEEKGLFLGAVDYITKPFRNSIVLARVNMQLQIIRYIRTIEQLCLIDSLTDLPNRRGFNERMNLEWERAFRENEPLSLLFIDMDNFKHYNDTYGHPYGDLLIQTVANLFRQTLKRSTDYIVRWGGDEFAVLLPNTNLNGAYIIAEKIRTEIQNTGIPCPNGADIHITVSIGVNSITPEKNDTIAAFLVETDNKLYEAKKSGKNRLSGK